MVQQNSWQNKIMRNGIVSKRVEGGREKNCREREEIVSWKSVKDTPNEKKIALEIRRIQLHIE